MMKNIFMTQIMKIVFSLLVAGIFFASSVMAITLPLPSSPPVQISGVSIVGGFIKIVWNPNTETDLAGYILYWNRCGTGGFVYIAGQGIDMGVSTEYLLSNLPSAEKVAGNSVCFGVCAYDTANNVSSIKSKTEGGADVKVFFEQNLPPASPSGERLQ